jgi:hypothetical protein
VEYFLPGIAVAFVVYLFVVGKKANKQYQEAIYYSKTSLNVLEEILFQLEELNRKWK